MSPFPFTGQNPKNTGSKVGVVLRLVRTILLSGSMRIESRSLCIRTVSNLTGSASRKSRD